MLVTELYAVQQMHRFEAFAYPKYCDLKPKLRVIRGHWKWCHFSWSHM